MDMIQRRCCERVERSARLLVCSFCGRGDRKRCDRAQVIPAFGLGGLNRGRHTPPKGFMVAMHPQADNIYSPHDLLETDHHVSWCGLSDDRDPDCGR